VLAEVGADRLVVSGDSAGGGLTLALMLRLKQEGIPLPAAVVPISAWTDLTMTAPSYTERADRDPFVSAALLEGFAVSYLGDHDRHDPLVSPLFGDLSGLPPLHIEVGSEEVMIDDSVQLHERALAAGTTSELVVTEGAPHTWLLFASFLPEAVDAIERIGAFVRQQIG
jgi:acetyl esterase/lipase